MSKQYIDLKKQIDNFFEQNLFPRLRDLVEKPDASTNEMFKIANYIFWAKKNGLNLKF